MFEGARNGEAEKAGVALVGGVDDAEERGALAFVEGFDEGELVRREIRFEDTLDDSDDIVATGGTIAEAIDEDTAVLRGELFGDAGFSHAHEALELGEDSVGRVVRGGMR